MLLKRVSDPVVASTRIPQLSEARWNPGAAKASDCEVSKSFCAFARRCYEARHPLEAPLIDVCSEAETHRLRCGRVAPRAFCRSQLRNPGSMGAPIIASAGNVVTRKLSRCLEHASRVNAQIIAWAYTESRAASSSLSERNYEERASQLNRHRVVVRLQEALPSGARRRDFFL